MGQRRPPNCPFLWGPTQCRVPWVHSVHTPNDTVTGSDDAKKSMWKNIAKKWKAPQEHSLEQEIQGRQASPTCLPSAHHGSCVQRESYNSLGQCQGGWAGIEWDWQTHKKGNMDQKQHRHESRLGDLQAEPHLGQYTYWHPKPEVSQSTEDKWRKC